MRFVSLLFLGLSVLCAGCGTWNDTLVTYEMRSPFCPDDPNEMLTELKRELPADVEIEYFLWKRKSEAMRGTVLVTSRKAGRAVCDAVRRHPRLASITGDFQEAYAGEFMVCISSQPPFAPASDTEVLEELRRDLPPGIRIAIDGSRRKEDYIVVWATVYGNFGKEVVKFACCHNPNLKALQVEGSTSFMRLLCRCRVGRVKVEK